MPVFCPALVIGQALRRTKIKDVYESNSKAFKRIQEVNVNFFQNVWKHPKKLPLKGAFIHEHPVDSFRHCLECFL